MAEETVIGTEPTIAQYKANRDAAAKAVVEVVEEPAVIEEDDPVEEAEETPNGEDKPKPRGGFQKKIDRLIKEVASGNEEKQRLKLELEEARKSKETPKQVAADGEPERKDFENDIAYVKALAKWEVRQEMKLEAEREGREAAEREHAAVVKSYNQKVVEAKATHEDWEEVMNQELDIYPAVSQSIFRMPNGPEVAYQLGKNPDLMEELMNMSIYEAIGKVWQLSIELSKSADEPEPEKKEKKAIPAPIRAVSAGTTRTSTVPIDKTSIAEYKRRTADARKTNQVRTVH